MLMAQGWPPFRSLQIPRATESFFATLECELLDRNTFKTHAEAKRAVFAFIEGFYNPRRRHSSLGYVSPADYERAYESRALPPPRRAQSCRRARPRQGAAWKRRHKWPPNRAGRP